MTTAAHLVQIWILPLAVAGGAPAFERTTQLHAGDVTMLDIPDGRRAQLAYFGGSASVNGLSCPPGDGRVAVSGRVLVTAYGDVTIVVTDIEKEGNPP